MDSNIDALDFLKQHASNQEVFSVTLFGCFVSFRLI